MIGGAFVGPGHVAPVKWSNSGRIGSEGAFPIGCPEKILIHLAYKLRSNERGFRYT